MVSSRRDRVDSAAPASPLFLSAYPPRSATPPGLVFVVRAPSRDSGTHPRVTTARSSPANLFGEPGRLPYPRAERPKARPSRSRPSRLSMSRLRYPLHVGITGKNREGRTQVSEIRRESESECWRGLFETRDEIGARYPLGRPDR